MITLSVHSKNKKQLAAVEDVLNALNIAFKKQDESPYDPEFVAMVKKAKKRGNYKTIDANNIWGSLNLK